MFADRGSTNHNELGWYGNWPLNSLLHPPLQPYGVVRNGDLEGTEDSVVDEAHDNEEEDGDNGDDEGSYVDGGEVDYGGYPGLGVCVWGGREGGREFTQNKQIPRIISNSLALLQYTLFIAQNGHQCTTCKQCCMISSKHPL